MRLFGIDDGKSRQDLIERKHVDRGALARLESLVERDTRRRATPLGRRPGTGALHEDLAHRQGRNREEMCAIGEGARAFCRKPDERFVDERGGLEGLPGTLAADVARRDPPKLVVDERHQVRRPAVRGL